MPIGGQNQTNRLGHGVLSKSETLAGQVAYAAAGEKTLATIIAAVVTANARGPAWSPFEVRLIGTEAGQLRTKTTVAGFPLARSGGGVEDAPTVIFLAQNDQSPVNDVIIYMSAASTLSVLLIG